MGAIQMITGESATAIVVPARLRGGMAARPTRQPPRDFESLRALVERRMVCLPRRLGQAAAYLLAHPDEIAFDPLVTIGKRAGVSPSCIVRLSQRLGFDGFSQMQLLFQRRLTPTDADAPARRGATSDPLRDAAQTAERALRRLDRETSRVLLVHAVDVLAAARTVFVIGDGPSAGPALLAADAFRAIGLRTVAIGSFAAGLDATALATTADACLVFDLSAEGEPVTAKIKGLLARKVPVVLVAPRPARAMAGLTVFDLGEGDLSASAMAATCLALAMTPILRERRHGAAS